jgi:hypothetical protein
VSSCFASASSAPLQALAGVPMTAAAGGHDDAPPPVDGVVQWLADPVRQARVP